MHITQVHQDPSVNYKYLKFQETDRGCYHLDKWGTDLNLLERIAMFIKEWIHSGSKATLITKMDIIAEVKVFIGNKNDDFKKTDDITSKNLAAVHYLVESMKEFYVSKEESTELEILSKYLSLYTLQEQITKCLSRTDLFDGDKQETLTNLKTTLSDNLTALKNIASTDLKQKEEDRKYQYLDGISQFNYDQDSNIYSKSS